MRYACIGGGKRFRPFLVIESAALFAVPRERALMAAAALECDGQRFFVRRCQNLACASNWTIAEDVCGKSLATARP